MFESYNSVVISIVFLLLYFISNLLVKTKKISLIVHKKFWNSLLAISFLVSGVLGLILAFKIDSKSPIGWYTNVLWFHVEFGIVMALIAIFHLIWHFKYYFLKS